MDGPVNTSALGRRIASRNQLQAEKFYIHYFAEASPQGYEEDNDPDFSLVFGPYETAEQAARTAYNALDESNRQDWYWQSMYGPDTEGEIMETRCYTFKYGTVNLGPDAMVQGGLTIVKVAPRPPEEYPGLDLPESLLREEEEGPVGQWYRGASGNWSYKYRNMVAKVYSETYAGGDRSTSLLLWEIYYQHRPQKMGSSQGGRRMAELEIRAAIDQLWADRTEGPELPESFNRLLD